MRAEKKSLAERIWQGAVAGVFSLFLANPLLPATTIKAEVEQLKIRGVMVYYTSSYENTKELREDLGEKRFRKAFLGGGPDDMPQVSGQPYTESFYDFSKRMKKKKQRTILNFNDQEGREVVEVDGIAINFFDLAEAHEKLFRERYTLELDPENFPEVTPELERELQNLTDLVINTTLGSWYHSCPASTMELDLYSDMSTILTQKQKKELHKDIDHLCNDELKGKWINRRTRGGTIEGVGRTGALTNEADDNYIIQKKDQDRPGSFILRKARTEKELRMKGVKGKEVFEGIQGLRDDDISLGRGMQYMARYYMNVNLYFMQLEKILEKQGIALKGVPYMPLFTPEEFDKALKNIATTPVAVAPFATARTSFGVPQIFNPSGRGKDDLTDFIVDLFGKDIDVEGIKEYVQARGRVRDLRKLEGGYLSEGVVSLGDKVIKLDANAKQAKTQRTFYANEFDELGLYQTKSLSDKVTVVDGVALWDMTNVAAHYQTENLFDTSRRKRVPLNERPYDVIQFLTKDLTYADIQKDVKDKGARDLYDFIDHFMYVAGVFHKEAQGKITTYLPSGPQKIHGMDHTTRVLTFENQNEVVYAELKRLLPEEKIKELRQPLEEIIAALGSGNLTVIHGDFKYANTVDCAVVDPLLRFGKEYEDLARFLTDLNLHLADPSMDLGPSLVEHFLERYIQHRSTHDSLFRRDYTKQREIIRDYTNSQYEQDFRRLGCMHKRDLTDPQNMRNAEAFLRRIEQLYRNLV
jgi:hypothetical protein